MQTNKGVNSTVLAKAVSQADSDSVILLDRDRVRQAGGRRTRVFPTRNTLRLTRDTTIDSSPEGEP